MMFAQQGECTYARGHLVLITTLAELLKINHYKAPRDKLICILNCCKVIFGPLLSPLVCIVSPYLRISPLFTIIQASFGTSGKMRARTTSSQS